MRRRDFLHSSTLAAAGLSFSKPLAQAATTESLPSFDRTMEEFMRARGVPGGALAIVRQGRLIYAKGYGTSDSQRSVPTRADTLFRIASISKPVTGVGVMKLIQDGKLNLDDAAFDHIDLEPWLGEDARPDPRLKEITIRQCLQHTGGWDRKASFDPMFRATQIASKLGVNSPADARAVIRYMMGRPLDFAPGQKYAYSNFGYCVLGRVIEKITGKTYEDYMRKSILAPWGIKRMRIGHSLAEHRAKGETDYFMPDRSKTASVFPGQDEHQVPWPYGGFNLEAMDAHGGWIASAVDLARFAAALDMPHRQDVLAAKSIGQLYDPPAAPVSRKDGRLAAAYYGLGWSVRPVRSGGANYWHTGSLPGTYTLLVRRADGISWTVLFNQRSKNKRTPDSAIDSALHKAAAAVRKWPTKDLFKEYG